MEGIQQSDVKDMVEGLNSSIMVLELKALRLRQQARSLEQQADKVDEEASGYATARNTLELLMRQAQQKQKLAEAEASKENENA